MFGSKKRKRSGLGKSPISPMGKIIEELNYSPVAYQLSAEWTSFCRDFPHVVEKTLKKVNVDDLNATMFHPTVDSAADTAIRDAQWQLGNHLHTIRHDRGIFKGRLSKAKNLLSDLQQDMKDLECEIEHCKSLR